MKIELLALKFYEHARYMRGHAASTVKRYQWTINYYLLYSGFTDLDQISTKNLQEFFLHGRVDRHWKPNTTIGIYRGLTVFLRWCVENDYLKINPLSGIMLPKLEYQLPKKLTKQMAMRLLEVAYNYPYQHKFLKYRNHAIFATFIFAGLRKSELLNLKYNDVDVANMTIFVRQGKGHKDRTVPISHSLAESLTRYISDRKRLGKTCPEFFCSLSLNSGFTATGLKRLVVKMNNASRIKFHIHMLRHTFATLMLEGGCDIYSISRLLGHADIKTTTIYLSASVEHLRFQLSKHPLNTLVLS